MILVIHPGALGDVLQAVPALVALRALPDGDRLTFAGQPRLGRLFAGTGVVDQSIAFDGLGLEALFVSDPLPPTVRSRLAVFDRIVSWFGSRADGFADRLRSIVADTLVAPPGCQTPVSDTAVWEHLVSTLAPWGVAPPAELAPLALPEAWRAEARLALSRLGRDDRRPLLVVHPGAGGKDKLWPAERFARAVDEVARATGCQVLVHQGPADREAAGRLIRHLHFPSLLLVEPPLEHLVGVLQQAGAYLGGDSGVSHLAAAVGAPAVLLFPRATRERWAPWSASARPLTLTEDRSDIEAACRACVECLIGRRLSHDVQSPGRILTISARPSCA